MQCYWLPKQADLKTTDRHSNVWLQSIFLLPSRKFETSQEEVCWDSGTNLFSIRPLTDIWPVYAAQCPIISRKWKSAHREGSLMSGPACMLGRSLWSILWPPVFFLDNQAWLVWPGLKDTDRECQNMPVHNCSNLSQYKTYSFCIAWVLWNCYYCVCFTLKKQAAIHFI